MSLREGYLPPLLKSAVVRPLSKQSPPQSIQNDIRPISLTPVLAKLFEGLVLSRVLPNTLQDLDITQLAMGEKSTSHAITYMLNLAPEALDSGGCWI